LCALVVLLSPVLLPLHVLLLSAGAAVGAGAGAAECC
jgi:hypothetical protein